MMIAGFILAHLTMIAIILGYAVPRYYDAMIPIERRVEGTEPTVAMQTKNELAGQPISDTVAAERGDALPAYADSSSTRTSHRGKSEVVANN